MDTNELLKLLDLKNTRAGPHEAPAFALYGDSPAERGAPTALDVDAWGLRRGRDLLATSERIQKCDLDAFAVADCHAAAFDPDPRLVPFCRDVLRGEFFRALLDTPAYRSLQQSTTLDTHASEIAAVHFAEEFDRFRRTSEQAQPKAGMEREVGALRAASRALEAARMEVDECQSVLTALGLGPGCPGHNDARAIAELFRRVRNDPCLRTICSLAGRFRRLAQSRQRRKTRHGVDDIVGAELSGDLGRVLPYELMKVTTAPFELEALRRLVEHQLMSREHNASEPVGKGPIVVVLDESGSMAGEPIHSAKAIALALAWIARQQNRWCALVAYSGDSGERLLPLPVGRWNEQALADWLSAFLGRGSTLDVPIAELPRMLADLKAPAGETDIIAVTDCVCNIPTEMRATFNAWKKSSGARLITIVIGEDAGDLIHVSDEAHGVRTLTVVEEAVGRALSI